MTKPLGTAVALLLSLLAGAAHAAVDAGDKTEFIRAYVRALQFGDDANKPFVILPDWESGTPKQVAEFVEQTKLARGSLRQAVGAVEPFTASVDKRIAASATAAKRVYEARDALCDRWIELYSDVAAHRGTRAELTKRVVELRRQIDAVGRELGETAVAVAWAIVKIDAKGSPRRWAITPSERRTLLLTLRNSFGANVVRGPKRGMNYTETAAATLATFLSREEITRDARRAF